MSGKWWDVSWNFVTGCDAISEACDNCWARGMARRLAGRCGYPQYPNHFDVTLHPGRLDMPRRWRKPRRVFVCDMSDLFHERVPFDFVRIAFDIMRETPRHTYFVLTKRPWRMDQFFLEYPYMAVKNVWLGVTAESQVWADERIPRLLRLPLSSRRYVSIEPMLGDIDLGEYVHGLDWVICGGEAGPGARSMNPEWVRHLRNQCISACVPFFFKQWGSASGRRDRLLDGEEWNDRG